MLDELINHIYAISSHSANSFRRMGSDGYNSSFGQSMRRSFKYTPQIVAKYLYLIILSTFIRNYFFYCREVLNENNETEMTELDTEKFVPIAVECLAILIKLNDTIEVSTNMTCD